MSSLYHGVGAKCSVLLRYLKPSKLVNDVFVNAPNGFRVEELLTTRQQLQKVGKKETMCFFFRHEKFSQEVYCSKRWAKVVTNGPEGSRFPGEIRPQHLERGKRRQQLDRRCRLTRTIGGKLEQCRRRDRHHRQHKSTVNHVGRGKEHRRDQMGMGLLERDHDQSNRGL